MLRPQASLASTWTEMANINQRTPWMTAPDYKHGLSICGVAEGALTLLWDIPAEQRKPVCCSTAALISSTITAPTASCSSALGSPRAPAGGTGREPSHCCSPLDLCISVNKNQSVFSQLRATVWVGMGCPSLSLPQHSYEHHVATSYFLPSPLVSLSFVSCPVMSHPKKGGSSSVPINSS